MCIFMKVYIINTQMKGSINFIQLLRYLVLNNAHCYFYIFRISIIRELNLYT